MVMAVFALGILLLLAMAGPSVAPYCVCNPSAGDTALQRNIDYACGNGADCTPIHETGACYNPNTVVNHCNYAVNSYYQRRSQGPDTCNFTGTASVTQTAPAAASGCVYQSSPSSGGTGNTPPSGGNNTNPGVLPGSPLSPGVIPFSPPDGTSASLMILPSLSLVFLLMYSSIVIFFSGWMI